MNYYFKKSGRYTEKFIPVNLNEGIPKRLLLKDRTTATILDLKEKLCPSNKAMLLISLGKRLANQNRGQNRGLLYQRQKCNEHVL